MERTSIDVLAEIPYIDTLSTIRHLAQKSDQRPVKTADGSPCFRFIGLRCKAGIQQQLAGGWSSGIW